MSAITVAPWKGRRIDQSGHTLSFSIGRHYLTAGHGERDPTGLQLLILVRPTPTRIRLAYEGSFAGMTMDPVPLDILLATREKLFRELPAALDANEREFLRTLARVDPDWSLLGIPHLEELPAIRWRLKNLEELARSQPERLRALADALDAKLG